MRAKDLATVAGTTVRTIRYYHQLGLLSVPERGTTWRSYGFSHLTRLMRIRWLVESGVPLAEVPHLLRSPDANDERGIVTEDLEAVRASINEKIAVLTAQRERVEMLLERVATEGRLSPVPSAVDRLYAALLAPPTSASIAEAISRERDLVELACYRGALPDDIVVLVDALTQHSLDELCSLWQECLRLSAQREGGHSAATREQVLDVARRTVDLAVQAEPDATGRLLRRAGELDRPAVRAAFELAYPSVVLRQFVSEIIVIATERSSVLATERSSVVASERSSVVATERSSA